MGEKSYYRAEDIREAAHGRWRDVLSGLGFPSEQFDGRHRPCAGCQAAGRGAGKDRFRFDDQHGDGSWLCSQGGAGTVSGDGIALYMHLKGCDFRQACEDLGAALKLKHAGGHGHSSHTAAPKPGYGPVAPEPRQGGGKPAFRFEALEGRFRAEFDEGWLRRKSPVLPDGVTAEVFLQMMYRREERVLVIDRLQSQGDYLFWHGHGTYRLGQRPGIRAVRSPLPTGGPVGVYFLAQPVDGQWKPNGGKLSRRSGPNVQTWRYLLIEHDPPKDASPEEKARHFRLWLSFLCQVPLPIASLVTSGGWSVHALCRLDDFPAKAHFDALRAAALHYLVPFGMDPGAVSGVRLTRLPSCLRGQAKQRLLYLNPTPDPAGVPIADGGNVCYA